MERHSIRPYILTTGLLLLAVILLVLLPPVRETGLTGIRDALPDKVGDYVGTELRYCQNEHCLKVFTLPELAGATACPACGSALGEVAMAERLGLPAGTTIVRRRYALSADQVLLVTVLLAGRDRNSFHRPQLCLPAQGFVIEGHRVMQAPINGRSPLRVQVLDLRRQGGDASGHGSQRAFLAYWFVSPARETPSNLGRLFWMMTDRIIRGRADRWAYVTVFAQRAETNAGWREDLSRFIGQLYPALAPVSQ